jgi:hypothetical protein
MRVASILARHAAASTSNPAQLTTQGFPICRAISEAWAVRPPHGGQRARGCGKAGAIGRVDIRPHQNHRLA